MAPHVLVIIGNNEYTPMLDNEPTAHKFCWPKASYTWVGPEDYDSGKICVVPEEADVDTFYVVIDGNKAEAA